MICIINADVLSIVKTKTAMHYTNTLTKPN